jgi:hypothetical protein
MILRLENLATAYKNTDTALRYVLSDLKTISLSLPLITWWPLGQF